MALRLVIVGGGPAGNSAATYGARLGAEVTLIEREVIGGAAHMWAWVPSQAMSAPGGAGAGVWPSGPMAAESGDVASEGCRQLPAALKVLDPAAEQILSDRQAADVRGQWILSLDLPLVAARIQGQGRFDLNVLTISSGVFSGTPVMVNVTVGSRDAVIRAPSPAMGIH